MNRLTKLREERKLTVLSLSQKVNIDYDLILIFEKGNVISENHITILAEYFNVLPSYLMNLQDERFPQVENFLPYYEGKFEWFKLAIIIIDRLYVNDYLKKHYNKRDLYFKKYYET